MSTRRAISRTAHACVREPKGNRYERRGGGGAQADLYDFGLLGEQSSQKWEISCLGRRAKFDAASFILGEERYCFSDKPEVVYRF